MGLHAAQHDLDATVGEDLLLCRAVVRRQVAQRLAARLLHGSRMRVRAQCCQDCRCAAGCGHLRAALGAARGRVLEHPAARLLEGLLLRVPRHGFDRDLKAAERDEAQGAPGAAPGQPVQRPGPRQLHVLGAGAGPPHGPQHCLQAARCGDPVPLARAGARQLAERIAVLRLRAGVRCASRQACQHDLEDGWAGHCLLPPWRLRGTYAAGSGGAAAQAWPRAAMPVVL
mmetsp:Transcript_76410/g.211054  ORF Transcript_76410/g.211054 Transcript_76410/m.211054 type:complete len:228 (+) Transcript_76410:662-1345(+)